MLRNEANALQFTHILTSSDPSLESGVFILDTTWGVFVLVGADARDKREDIRLALATAEVIWVSLQYNTHIYLFQTLVSTVGPLRPFVPPIHVIVFPSQVPQDLRLGVRGLDFEVRVRAIS